MNPILQRMGAPMIPGPLGTVANVMQIVGKLKQDPSQIGQLLKDSGRINQAQLEEIQKMKSPSEIGQYLMNSGIMQQQHIDQAQAYYPNYRQAIDQQNN